MRCLADRDRGKRALSLLEAKTGSGKTLAVLSAAASFWDAYPTAISRIVFLCRTIPVVDHVLGEIFHLNKARSDAFKSVAGATASSAVTVGAEPSLKKEPRIQVLEPRHSESYEHCLLHRAGGCALMNLFLELHT